MLIPRGHIVHENLSTAFTHIDQFVDGLREKQFSGYCHVSFWEYDGVLFFEAGNLINAREETGMRAMIIHIGDVAIRNILAKAHEKDGEISIYELPGETVAILVGYLKTETKYEKLSTDLTSLDKVIGLLQKERLSGYIEVLLEEDAGIADLFFANGELVDSLIAPPDNQMIGEPVGIEDIHALCQAHGAVFDVYQASDVIAASPSQEDRQTADIPQRSIALFEAILTALEKVANATMKDKDFQRVFKTILPKVADNYAFLDPFIGDFRYANGSLSYTGEATYSEFIDGLCDVINTTLEALLQDIPRNVLLPKISTGLEPVSTTYADLVEQLNLEVRLPELFRDYLFVQEDSTAGETRGKGSETHTVLNLQGIKVSELPQERILREFYRVISSIAEKYVETGTNIVNYSRLKKSREFKEYQTATALLQKFDLSYLQDRDSRLAFWLNLYNFLVIDGVLEVGVSKSIRDVKGFFSKTSYRLGGLLFSPDDIEHGILRNNQRRPYSLFRQFPGSDPRKSLGFAPPDNRVHCCFCCAAKSGPPLVVYTSKNLDQQMNLAVTRYLLTNGMRLDQEKNELWLSRTFYWYRKDFETDGNTLFDFIIRALDHREIGQFIQQNRANLTLRFLEYDWSLNEK